MRALCNWNVTSEAHTRNQLQEAPLTVFLQSSSTEPARPSLLAKPGRFSASGITMAIRQDWSQKPVVC